MKPRSYSAWAVRIVSRADRRSLRFDSCCRVLVVNGGTGLRVVGFSSTAATLQLPLSIAWRSVWASSSASSRTLLPDLRAPVFSSKSEPPAMRLPLTWVSLASKPLPACSRRAFRSQ